MGEFPALKKQQVVQAILFKGNMHQIKNLNYKNKFIYNVICFIFKTIGKLPQATGEQISKIIGHLCYLLDKRHRKITITNLSYAYADTMNKKEIRLLAKKVFANFIMALFRIGWSMNIELSDFHKWFSIRGEKNLRAAMEKRRGILFLTAHLGSWELLPFFFGYTGLAEKGTSVYKPLKSPALEKIVTDIRQRFGGSMYPMKRALKHIKEALKKNGCAVLLMDQSTRMKRGAVIDFFGRKTYGNNGMARLALQTESPVVPIFLVKEKNKYLIIICPEIPLTCTGEEKNDIQVNTQKYNKVIENIINEYPDQYFWLHNRWKHVPPRKSTVTETFI